MWRLLGFALIAIVSLKPAASSAQSTDASATVARVVSAPRRHRILRDRWRNTISIGLTAGAGGPLGIVGGFVEYRPIKWVSGSVGAGMGGTFGPAVGGTLYIDPL